MILMLLVACVVLLALNYSSTRRIERRVDLLIKPAPQFPRAYNGPAGMLAIALGLGLGSSAIAQELRTDPPRQMMELDPAARAWYVNPDGSCVQCSIGMAGLHANNLNAATLLWDTEFGPAIRGGSNPMRVEDYCNRRGIVAWSVTGSTVDDTRPWMEWAARTGRFAAVGCGRQHFQTLYGYDPRSQEWYVCNNNSTHRIDRYTDQQFRQLHAESGPWCVILEKSRSVPPRIRPWWVAEAART